MSFKKGRKRKNNVCNLANKNVNFLQISYLFDVPLAGKEQIQRFQF